MRLVLRPQLIDQVADQIVPLTVEVPSAATGLAGQRLALTDLIYCGTDDRGAGLMLGVIAEGQGRMPAASLGASACNLPLSAIAAHALQTPSGPEWVEAARIRLTWQPWRLTLDLSDAAGAARAGFTAPGLPRAVQVAQFATAGLQPLTGAGQNLRFDLAAAFRRNAIVIDAYPSGGPAEPATSFPSEAALASLISEAPAPANMIAEARYPLINQLLATYAPSFDVPLNLQGLAATVQAHDLSLSGGENQASLTGKVASPSLGQDLIYDARVDCAGDDLTVQQVAMEAVPMTCDQTDMMARLQCQARQMTADGSARALAAALTAYYQNQPLHISTRGKPLQLTFGGVDYEANFAALKTGSHGGLLSEAGQASLQRGSRR